jgi:hypothetical protein
MLANRRLLGAQDEAESVASGNNLKAGRLRPANEDRLRVVAREPRPPRSRTLFLTADRAERALSAATKTIPPHGAAIASMTPPVGRRWYRC